MHHARVVRVIEAEGDADEDLDLVGELDGLAARDQGRQVLAAQELLHQVGRLPLHAALVDRRDVRMVQAAGQLGLLEKAGLDVPARIAHLDRHRPLDDRIPGFEDRAEPARADPTHDPILADRAARLAPGRVRVLGLHRSDDRRPGGLGRAMRPPVPEGHRQNGEHGNGEKNTRDAGDFAAAQDRQDDGHGMQRDLASDQPRIDEVVLRDANDEDERGGRQGTRKRLEPSDRNRERSRS